MHHVAVKIMRTKQKDLAKNAGGNLEDTNTSREGIIMDKGAKDPPCTNCCKRKMSDPDKENSDTWAICTKKSRVSARSDIDDKFVLLNSLRRERESASSFVMGRSGRG